jgi:hypothetical protein
MRVAKDGPVSSAAVATFDGLPEIYGLVRERTAYVPTLRKRAEETSGIRRERWRAI